MKNILILSYHALPLDVIASYRANAYLRHFYKYGYRPTLVTHHYGADEDNKEMVIDNHSYGTVIRLPYKKRGFWNWWSQMEKLPVINKVFILVRWLMGHLDSNPSNDIASYMAYKAFVKRHMIDHKYDLCMGIFSPHHHLRLCYEINQTFNIPYVLDFRDLWNNQVIYKYYQPSISEKIQDVLFTRHWRKWINHADFFSITSEAWRSKINEFSLTKGVVITNGYDPEYFEGTPKINSSIFKIIHAGSLYTHQPLNIFLEGCKMFLEREKPDDFLVSFIGADRHALPNNKTSFLYQPNDKIHSILPKKHCEVTERIPKTDLIDQLKSCQVLLFPGMPDSPGTHLGKIFDYLASGVNILMAPDDNDVVGELIRETKSGVIANTPEEVCKQLISWYEEWLENGQLKWHGNREEIDKYSRESQVEKLAEEIDLTDLRV